MVGSPCMPASQGGSQAQKGVVIPSPVPASTAVPSLAAKLLTCWRTALQGCANDYIGANQPKDFVNSSASILLVNFATVWIPNPGLILTALSICVHFLHMQWQLP